MGGGRVQGRSCRESEEGRVEKDEMRCREQE
jgi:hypothetical protein